MRDTLPNGVTVEGTLEQINATRRALGFDVLFVEDGVHYNSSSKGVVRIDTMDSRHIKNAIRKIWAAKVSALNTNASNPEFLQAIQLLPRDKTLQGLVSVLLTRLNERV